MSVTIPSREKLASLPQHKKAEWGVIGSCLVAPELAIPKAARILEARHFVDPWHFQIFRAFVDRHRGGQPIDPLLVAQDVATAMGSSKADEVQRFLEELHEKTPTAAHVDHYAQQVLEVARKREVVSAAHDALHDAKSKSARELAAELGAVCHDLLRDTGDTEASDDYWPGWLESLHLTDRQTTYEIDSGDSQLNRFAIAPGMITVLGGKQGLGKTCLIMQVLINILLLYPELRALVANCEMAPPDLLDRQLARFSRVPSHIIQQRTYAGQRREGVLRAAKELAELRTRLSFMAPPFTVPRVADLATAMSADIVVVDYAQRFKPGTKASDQRMQMSDCMNELRELAMRGPAVVALSAMSREGHFRESSEIEYGADFAFVLEEVDNVPGQLTCKCLKNRHGQRADIALEFDGKYQEMLAPAEVVPFEEFAQYAGDFAE